MKPRNFIGEVESRYLSTLRVSTVSAPITIMSRGANSSYNLVMWWRHKLYNRKCTSSVCSKHFFKAQNDFINDFTALHKHSNLILALQLYIKRSYTTLYPEKISCKSICILDNRNIQITITDREKKNGGGDRLSWDNIWFFSHFLSWNSTLFRINAILPSILCIDFCF